MNLSETIERISAHNPDETLVEYREKQALFTRISKKSEKYVDAPSSAWPSLHFNWDTSKDGQRHSLDGLSQEKFEECYPFGLRLGWVILQEFDAKLCNYSRRDEGELWKVGSKGKLARLIVYLSEGRRISPPLAKPISDSEVILNGGHHRYAIATDYPYIDRIITVRWDDA